MKNLSPTSQGGDGRSASVGRCLTCASGRPWDLPFKLPRDQRPLSLPPPAPRPTDSAAPVPAGAAVPFPGSGAGTRARRNPLEVPRPRRLGLAPDLRERGWPARSRRRPLDPVGEGAGITCKVDIFGVEFCVEDEFLDPLVAYLALLPQVFCRPKSNFNIDPLLRAALEISFRRSEPVFR